MPDYAYQYTFRQGEVMINVPIEETDPDLAGDEIEDKLGTIFAKAERSASVQAELNARGTAAGILGARSVPNASTGQQGASQAASGDPMAPVCECGERRKYKSGTSKSTGKAYSGYFCVNNRCKPEFK